MTIGAKSAQPGPLHPQRVQRSLEWLRGESAGYLPPEHRETLLKALTMVQSIQNRLGLSADMVNLSGRVRGVLEALQRLR